MPARERARHVASVVELQFGFQVRWLYGWKFQYEVKGQVFFADATQFANGFDYLHAPKKVVIDLTHAHSGI